jgi:hypothetical protein
MKSFEQMVNGIFGERLTSWRQETDRGLLFDYVVINLNDEPTGQDKASIIEYLKSRYPEVFVIENHHTRESDFQLRVYTR